MRVRSAATKKNLWQRKSEETEVLEDRSPSRIFTEWEKRSREIASEARAL